MKTYGCIVSDDLWVKHIITTMLTYHLEMLWWADVLAIEWRPSLLAIVELWEKSFGINFFP